MGHGSQHDRIDVLAEYTSDDGDRIRILARVRTRLGARFDPDGLERQAKFNETTIEVTSNGRLVESLPLRTDLSKFSRRTTNDLLGEINALKDSHADPDEVVGELHTLLG